jgi:hypothetical protein
MAAIKKNNGVEILIRDKQRYGDSDLSFVDDSDIVISIKTQAN